jgi:predicted DNA-binding protein (UPF0251 family)
LIPQPPVAIRTSPVPQGEDHREGHVADRPEGKVATCNNAVEAIELYDKGLVYAEIAGSVGVSEQSVRRYLAKARKKTAKGKS